jgi:hypothetical protein
MNIDISTRNGRRSRYFRSFRLLPIKIGEIVNLIMNGGMKWFNFVVDASI